MSELTNAFESGNFAPALKEVRKVKRASKTDGEKKFAQYFESAISIWKDLVEGRRQGAVNAMDKLNQNCKRSPIQDPDLALFFQSYFHWLRWDVKQTQALDAYGRGDLVEYEKCVAETRSISDSIRAETKDSAIDSFVDGYALQNDGLLPLSDAMKAALTLDFDHALPKFREAISKLKAAVQGFRLAAEKVPRGKLFVSANQGYHLCAISLYEMTRGDLLLFRGKVASAKNCYAKAIRIADQAIPLLSSVGFLGAAMLAYLVQARANAIGRQNAIKVAGVSKKESKRGTMALKPIFVGRIFSVKDNVCFVLAPPD